MAGNFPNPPALALPVVLLVGSAVLWALSLLLLSRHALDTGGQPVEWAQSWYRGDRYKFVTRLRRPPETQEDPRDR